jgi:hypothetical protein
MRQCIADEVQPPALPRRMPRHPFVDDDNVLTATNTGCLAVLSSLGDLVPAANRFARQKARDSKVIFRNRGILRSCPAGLS